MKKLLKIFCIAFLVVIISFAMSKQADAASYKRICPEEGKQSVTFGNIKYTMKDKPNVGYTVYRVKGVLKEAILSGVSSSVITDGKYMYYAVTPLNNGVALGTSTMYRYTILTGVKSKLFKKKMCDGSLEFGAVPCFAYKRYLYYGAQSQYGGKVWSLHVFDTKTKRNKKIKIPSSLLDGGSIKKSGNRIMVSAVNYKFETVEARYKFSITGGEVKKIK